MELYINVKYYLYYTTYCDFYTFMIIQLMSCYHSTTFCNYKFRTFLKVSIIQMILS